MRHHEARCSLRCHWCTVPSPDVWEPVSGSWALVEQLHQAAELGTGRCMNLLASFPKRARLLLPIRGLKFRLHLKEV